MIQQDADRRWARYLANPLREAQADRNYYYLIVQRRDDNERVALYFNSLTQLLIELPKLQELAIVHAPGRTKSTLTNEEMFLVGRVFEVIP